MGSYCVTGDSISPAKMGDHIMLDLEEWALVLSKMLRFHFNVSEDIKKMWALEYEVDELQTKFAESIGTMDLDNLDVDFIEDMMLKAKPLQSVLNCIRNRQIAKLEEVKKLYADQIKDLEVMKVTRPAKPVAAEKAAEPAAAPAPAPEAAKA